MNKKQKELLDEVVNEELTGRKPKFKWNDDFQKKILSMLLCDRYFLIQSLDKVKPEYFSNEAHVYACRVLYKYFNKYKELPEKFFLIQELLESIKDRDDSVKIHFRAEVRALYDFFVPGLETRDALIDKLISFAKVQAAKEAFNKVLPKIMENPEDEETWEYYYEQTRNVMLIDRVHEEALEYFTNIDDMFEMMKKQKDTRDRFTSGFEAIDNALTGGGFFRGEICSWIGMPGSGKSLALVKAAVANAKLGHKVMYITLELDTLGIAQRFTAQFLQRNINTLSNFEKEIKEEIDEFNLDNDDPNLLMVKQFPGGQLDVNGIRSFCIQAQMRYKFKPDLLIVDYVGEMKQDNTVKTHESMYRILRDLRGFGVEQQHATLTCVQPNRTASDLTDSQYIDESNIGGSFDQYKPLDALWSINQTVDEKSACVGRGFIVKHRNGKSRTAFALQFDYESLTLDISQISWDTYKYRRNKIKEEIKVTDPEETLPEKQQDKSKKNRGKRPPLECVKDEAKKAAEEATKKAMEEPEEQEPDIGEGA